VEQPYSSPGGPKAGTSASVIPQPLYEDLIRLRPYLRMNGTLGPRQEKNRKPAYRLRFRAVDVTGVRRQYSVAIGCDERVVNAVGELLAEWREQHQFEFAAEQRAVELKAAEDQKQTAFRETLTAVLNPKGNPENRAKVEAALAGGMIPTLALMLSSMQNPAPARRPGRRRKGRLW